MNEAPQRPLTRYFRNLDQKTEILSFVQLIFGIGAIFICGGLWVVAIDELPQFTHCCGEAGETYGSPSGLMMIASVVLFPLFIFAGFVILLLKGAILQSAVMFLIVAGWFALKLFRTY